jgi:hypothetical protein
MSGTTQDVAHLLKEAEASMKRDLKGAVAKLEAAYAVAKALDDPRSVAAVAEELARGWGRRKSAARALYYARRSTVLAPERKAAWTTLAKTCELVASRMSGDHRSRRSRFLYGAAAAAFKKAAALTKDPEDKRWLLELAGDAARQSKAAAPSE